MIIHVVQKGETINSIAATYGLSADRLILENEIKNPYNLVVGQTIVILYPEQTYIIQEGDTLGNIASKYGVTTLQLIRNNPFLSEREYIYPGEMIVISYAGEKIMPISTNGYAYPFIDKDTLKKTLPFLTYLTVFGYQVTTEGEINSIDDSEVIQIAKEYGVAPIMLVITAAQNIAEETNVMHSLLTNQDKQKLFIENLLGILKEKGYYGVSVNTSYILPMDRSLYVNFIAKLTERISSEGYKVFDTFSVNSFELITGTIYKGLEYDKIGKIVDGVTIISYEWGYSIGIPSGTVTLDSVKEFIDYMKGLIPSEKIIVGVPVIGYVWKLPYEPGESKGMSINYNTAIEIAEENNVEIQYDEDTISAYFQYTSVDENIVRFFDARSIDSFVRLVPQNKLNGIGIWNIMFFFPQMWMVINSQYDIEKVL